MDQPTWMAHAWAEFGQAERAGAAHNARILQLYRDAGHAEIASDEVAWCAAFVGACLERGGLASTRSLLARSYVDWGQPSAPPQPGAIAVLSRGNDPSQGHVGFLVGATSDQVFLLGGNQGDQVSVAAFPVARVLAFRWPHDGPEKREPEPHQDALFERALAHVLEMEGGWSEDPYDPGGPTNQGITLAEFADYTHRPLSAATEPVLKAELKAIAPEFVRAIYTERYWLPARCPDLVAALALMHFDAAVNQGVAAAARMLQEAVGAAIDGEIGPETLAAARSVDIKLALDRYADIRTRRYRMLAHFWRFGRGWLRRVELTRAAAAALLQEPMITEKESTMSDTRPAAPAVSSAEPKWWVHSVTVWGTVVTTLTAVLPIIGPVFGVDVTADLARQLGEEVTRTVQALGALIGVGMAIYGRARASAPLERRPVTLQL